MGIPDPHTDRDTSQDVARIRWPVIGTVAVVALVVVAVYLNEFAHYVAASFPPRDKVPVPYIHVATVTGWSLIGFLVWLVARILRWIGVHAPGVLATALPLLCLVLFLPISMAWRTMSTMSVPDVKETVNLLALIGGSAVLSTLVLRWHLAGKRIALRAPLAVVTGGTLSLSLAFGTVVLELWMTDREVATRLDHAPAGILDGDVWTISAVHENFGDGLAVVDLTNRTTEHSVYLTSIAASEHDTVLACDCDRRGSALVPSDEGRDPSEAYVEADGALFRIAPYSSHPSRDSTDIVELADQVRPASPAEKTDIQRRLVEHLMRERRVSPPYSLLDHM